MKASIVQSGRPLKRTDWPSPGYCASKSRNGPRAKPPTSPGIFRPSMRTGSCAAAAQTASTSSTLARTPLRKCRAGDRTGSGVHRLEELAVGLGVAQLVEQEVDRIHRSHRIEDTPQHVHLLQLLRFGKQLFLAGAGARDVDRREGALVGDLA